MSLIGTMDSGVSALRTFQKGLEVIGNNIANVNTTGFKSADAKYSDSFSNILQQSSPGSSSASDTPTIGVGTGVGLSGIATNFNQGSLSSTGNTTDLGISGNGYFVVKNGGITYATRAGSFRIDSNGYLTTQQGFRVQGLAGGTAAIPAKAAIPAVYDTATPPNLISAAVPAVTAVAAVPATTIDDIKLATPPTGTQLKSFSIDSTGKLVEFYSDGTSGTTNQVLLQNFKDQSALMPVGNGLYSGMDNAGPINGTPAALDATNSIPGSNGLGTLQAGTLELSNVDLTQQFANLITTQRSFQAASRLITVSDTVLEDITSLKTR